MTYAYKAGQESMTESSGTYQRIFHQLFDGGGQVRDDLAGANASDRDPVDSFDARLLHARACSRGLHSRDDNFPFHCQAKILQEPAIAVCAHTNTRTSPRYTQTPAPQTCGRRGNIQKWRGVDFLAPEPRCPPPDSSTHTCYSRLLARSLFWWVRMSLIRALRRGATPTRARWTFAKREFEMSVPREKRTCVSGPLKQQ